MFFILSKVLGIIFEPINFLVLLGLLGLILCQTRYRRAGSRMATGAAIVFAILCFSPLGGMLLRPLEERFPVPGSAMAAPTGIVVLGGGLDPDLSAARNETSLNEAAERLTRAVALSRQFPQARLVFTGGSANLRQTGTDEAHGARKLWLSLGVPEDRMTFEDKSRNTFENATMTRALVDPKPGETWLLVTSAWHMPRAVGIFRQVGWPVIPYPVDFRTFGDARDFKPSAGALESLTKIEIALHEWIGLVAYRLSGKTNALFPAP